MNTIKHLGIGAKTAIIVCIALLGACSSPQKLIDTGQYDDAISMMVSKLAGKKKKKAEHVQALEEAFTRATERDMKEADRLKSENRPENWARINDIYQRIRRRQDLISPLLPLVDENGVKAEFRFVRTNDLEREARENAAAHHYDRGKQLLEEGRRGSKSSARAAYNEFGKITEYFQDYKDRRDLMQEARSLGTVRVLLTIENEAPVVLPSDFEEIVTSMGVKDLNTEWTVYYNRKNSSTSIDYHVMMRITNIQVQPALVKEREFEEVKEIEEGFEYVLDSRGNVMKDSLGNDIKVPKKVLIRARVFETYQFKAATVAGKIDFYDTHSRELLDSQPIAADALFENYASTFTGDKRALSKETTQRLGNRPLPFPTDEAMLLTAAERLKPVVKDKVSRSRFFI